MRENHAPYHNSGLAVTTTGHEAADTTNALSYGHCRGPQVVYLPEGEIMAPYVPAHCKEYGDKTAGKDKASLPYLKKIQWVSFVIGKIHDGVCHSGANYCPDDYDKAHIHYLLRTYPFGFTDPACNPKGNGETDGYEKAVSMDGQWTYGKKIWKHGKTFTASLITQLLNPLTIYLFDDR